VSLFTTDSVTSADGARIVYQRAGSGPSLLIVHGTLATTGMYHPIAERLSRYYQVALVERRDYGISGSGARPATFARQAEDIASVLGALDGPSYVFGHSCGGLAALHTATIAAAKMRAMALYEPPIALAGGALAAVRDKCRALVRTGRGEDAVAAFWSAVGDTVSDADARPLAALFADRADGMLADLECITAMPAGLNGWPAVTTPVLLLTGEKTASTPGGASPCFGGI
jgi:pimeloyl-ACP methyl ester carboxylesterase